MKNKQAMMLLFIANSISGFAQGISMIAVPWYFTNVLKLPSMFGQIFFGVSLVSIFWGLYAGSLVDKHDRKRIFIGTSIGGALLLLSVAAYGFYYGTVPAALVSVVFAGTFFIYNIHYPCLYAFIQEISQPGDYGRVTSLIEIQGQLTTALAGAFAAILLGGSHQGYINLIGKEVYIGIDFRPIHLHEVFLLDGFTYVLAGTMVLFMQYTAIATRHAETEGIITRLKLGYHFLQKHPMLFLFGVLGSNAFVAIIVINFFLKPAYVENYLHRGADVFAAYEIYFAFGSLLAGAAIRHIFQRFSAVAAVIIMFVVCAAVHFVFTFNTSMAVFYIGGFFIGLTNAGSRVMRVTYLFHHTPNQLIGRTGGVFNTINLIFRLMFIAVFSLPFFFESNHVLYAFWAFGFFILISAIIMGLYYKRILAEKVVH